MSDFIRKAEKLIKSSAEKSIKDLLKVLDSEIKYPYLSDGETVNEPKLLSVIQGREETFNAAKEIMDALEIDRTNDKRMVSSICKSLETTFYEIDKVVNRDIRPEIINDDDDEFDEEIEEGDDKRKKRKPKQISDDFLKSIAKTKKEGILLNIKIYKTIMSLEDKDKLNEEKLRKAPMVSIAEKFAQRGR